MNGLKRRPCLWLLRLAVLLMLSTAGHFWANQTHGQDNARRESKKKRPDNYAIRDAKQGGTWIETPDGSAQFQMLVDHTNLPGKPPHKRVSSVQIAAYTQQAGSFSGVHTHGSDEIFYITSGELVNILDPGTVHQRFVTAKPGMVSVVRADQRVIHWVPSTNEPVKGLVIWAPGREEEHLRKAGFLFGKWRAPFQHQDQAPAVDRRINPQDIPAELRKNLKPPGSND